LVSGNITGGNVFAYDTVTGRLRAFASGQRVFKDAGSTDVFVDPNNADSYASLAKYTVQGRLIQRFTYPGGWYLPDGFALGTSSPALAHDQILVQSQAMTKFNAAKVPKLAVWTPATGEVRAFGYGFVVATYTDNHGAYSLVAWVPAQCLSASNCPLEVTDPVTRVTREIRSPLGFGFSWGAAFSPDGSQLAAFAKTDASGYGTKLKPVLIDVAARTTRVVSSATISVGDIAAWAQWLPGSERLIVGAPSWDDASGSLRANHFVVETATRRSTSFSFGRDWQHDVYSSVVVLP
jgi:hypothetical protein